MPLYTVYQRQMAVLDIDWHEEDHPRDDDGKFTSAGRINGSVSQSPQEKKSRVNIDFNKDNVLPKLNDDTIAQLGPDADKPILFKKDTIKRNLARHPEMPPEEYNQAISTALYAPELAGKANPNKPYYNLIARVGPEKNSLVLLDIDCDKTHCEIVHAHYLRDKSRNTITKKMEKENKKTTD